eukprot:2705137-Amphidinium_carterae.1
MATGIAHHAASSVESVCSSSSFKSAGMECPFPLRGMLREGFTRIYPCEQASAYAQFFDTEDGHKGIDRMSKSRSSIDN